MDAVGLIQRGQKWTSVCGVTLQTTERSTNQLKEGGGGMVVW